MLLVHPLHNASLELSFSICLDKNRSTFICGIHPEFPEPNETERNLLLQLRTMEHRRLREIVEVSILNQSPKRVSLKGEVKPAISADALVPSRSD